MCIWECKSSYSDWEMDKSQLELYLRICCAFSFSFGIFFKIEALDVPKEERIGLMPIRL